MALGRFRRAPRFNPYLKSTGCIRALRLAGHTRRANNAPRFPLDTQSSAVACTAMVKVSNRSECSVARCLAEAARQSPWPLCLGVAQLPALHQCRCVQHEEERHEECRNQQ